MQVAQTILKQLGGNKFLAMTGAYNLGGSKDSLSMKLRRNKSKSNYLVITLNADDTYSMTFKKFSMRTGKIEVIKEYASLYWDQLQEFYTDVTGQYTRL